MLGYRAVIEVIKLHSVVSQKPIIVNDGPFAQIVIIEIYVWYKPKSELKKMLSVSCWWENCGSKNSQGYCLYYDYVGMCI